MYTPTDLGYAIALHQTPQVGPTRYRQLIKLAGQLRDVFAPDFIDSLSQHNLPQKLINALLQPNWPQVEQALRWAEAADRHIVTIEHPLYPPQLKNLPDAPPLLYIMGEPAQTHRAQIAMVGSRKPTPYGISATEHLCGQLVAEGLVITSGLAHGIDATAHLACLAHDGVTIAVMGRGLYKIYPAQHTSLAERILAKNGCLISEFSLDTQPAAYNFPQRNRLISGLSLGTIVCEAQIKSGSLITAKYAADQGKEVFAIPGSIFNASTQGTHHLIQQGAKLITSAQDIMDELQFEVPVPSCPTSRPALEARSTSTDQLNHLGDNERALLDILGYDPVSIDTLQTQSGLTIDRLSSMLLSLELEDWVAKDASGCYQRIK